MKKILKIAGVIVVALILLLLIAPLLISAETLKKELIAQASEATGRSVQVGGKVSLKLFPTISVSAQDVTIGNPGGFNSPYLLHTKLLSTGAALMPLLQGNLTVTGIALDDADVRLEQTVSGAKNWEFTKEKVQQKAASSAEKNAASSSASMLKSFALGDISIKNSAVRFSKPGQTSTLDEINVTIKGADANSPLKVDGNARYKGLPMKLTAQVDQLRPFLEGSSSPVKLDAELPGGALHFAGSAALKQAIAAQGDLALAISDIPQLLSWATGQKAAPHPKSLEIKGALAANGMRFALTNTTLSVDGVAATGNLAANLEGSVPAISGSLKFGALDLDTMLNLAAAEPRVGFLDAEAAASSGWSTRSMDLSPLNIFNADIHTSADALTVDKLKIGSSALHAVLSGGALTVTLEKAALYSGSATGNVSANASGAVAADVTLSGVQIEPLLNDLDGSSRLRGTATLKVNLKGSGASERAIVSSLAGNGSFNVANGAIKGVNLAQFWREAKQGLLFGNGGGSQSTDFSELTGTFAVTQGILSNSDLAMKSPALRLSGKGTVNLPAETINYRLVPSIVETSKGQGGEAKNGFAIPLDVSGPLSNPSVIPDVKSIVQQQLKNPAAIKKTVQNAGKGAGKLLKSLGLH